MQMTYCGPLGEGSSSLIAWLSAVPGVHPIHPGANPATWMLVRTLARLHPLQWHTNIYVTQLCLVWPCLLPHLLKLLRCPCRKSLAARRPSLQRRRTSTSRPTTRYLLHLDGIWMHDLQHSAAVVLAPAF